MRVVSAVSFLLALCALQASAEDVVVLRDGSQRSGRLERCADDACRLSGARIAMSEIAAIFLNGDGTRQQTIPATPNVVVMRDGSVRKGVVTFLNLGVVEAGDEELERSEVAAIIFAADPRRTVRPAVSDVVILRDRSSIGGELRVCNAAACTVDTTPIPLATIEWIGLGRADPMPPAATSPTSDEVHKSDGTIANGRLTGITSTSVSTRGGKFTRAETAWIHLAPPVDDSEQPDQIGAPESPEPEPPKPPKPPKKRRSSRPPTSNKPAPPPDLGEGKPGGLWTGTIYMLATGLHPPGGYAEGTAEVKVTLREIVYPLRMTIDGAMKVIGTITRLDPTGSMIKNTFYVSSPGSHTTSGEGSVNVTTPEYSCSSIFAKTLKVDTTPLLRVDIPSTGLYAVCVDDGNAEFEVETRWEDCRPSCYAPAQPETTAHGFLTPVIGRLSPDQGSTGDPQYRTFDSGPGKMQGNFTVPASGIYQEMQVSWSICREGVKCSPPPPLKGRGDTAGPGGRRRTPEDDDDDCTKLARLIDGLKALLEVAQAHQASYKESVEKRDAARDAIFGASGGIAKFVVSLEGLLAEGVKGALGDLLGLASAVTGLAQDFSADSAMQIVGELAGTDAAFLPAEASALRNAITAADKYVTQTGDLDGSLRIYAGHIGRSEALAGRGKKIVKGLSVASAIVDFTDTTIDLADSIQNFDLHRTEANSHKTSMDDADQRMEEKNDEISETRRGLRGPCPGIPSTNDVPVRESSFRRPAMWVHSTMPYVLVQGGPPANSSDPQVSATEVRQTVESLAGVEQKLLKAVPWLLPFLARMTDGVDPRLLAALLRRAEPDLRAAGADIETATKAARKLEARLRPSSGRT